MGLSSVQLSKGWATFGLVLPQWAAQTVRVGNLATQTDIKGRWPDGSTKFAVVTAWSPSAGSYSIDAGPQATGAFSAPTYPTSHVEFTVAGETWIADPNHATVIDSWLFGSLVREYRVVVPAISRRTGLPHPTLQVLYDSRIYNGGIARLDVTVQDVMDVTAGAAVDYDANVWLNGKVVGTYRGLSHGYLQRWRRVYSTKPLSTVQQDLESFYVAGAIPRFLKTVVDPIPTIDPVRFAPLGYGDMSADMAGPGGRPEIGPYPNWTAQYLVHQRPEQKAYMLASADCSGSWRGHITEPDGTTLISLDTYPDYWLDGRSGTHPTGPQATRVDHNGGPWPGGWSWPIDTAHHPSLTYVPYLLTGDRFYLDQMKFWANFTLLSTWPGANNSREGAKGILIWENQARGIGWAIRTLGEVAAYAPDSDPMKGYFTKKLQNNLSALEDMASTANGGRLGTLFNFAASAVNASWPGSVTSLWANSYIGWALDRARTLGFSPSGMRTRIATTQVAFSLGEAQGIQHGNGGPYYPTIALNSAFLDTIMQVYDATWAVDPRMLRDYYPEARLMLQIGARDGIAGAQQALTYLLGIIGNDVNSRSGFAVLP